jgi:hypothetical protein
MVANIGPRERRKRLIGGVVMLLVAIGLAVILVRSGVPRAWRAAVFIPLWASATGFVQARHATCVALAAMGCQNLDGGTEPVADPTLLERMRAQARTVNVQALVTAVLLTAAVVLLPA